MTTATRDAVMTQDVAPAAAAAVATARGAQHAWARRPLGSRLRVIKALRHLVADRGRTIADRLTAANPTRSSAAETLTAEVLPLADACRFLEREAARLLRPRRLGRRGRPAWLAGARAEIRREPHGVVLIVGPSNYPFFLPGIQALQALTAGNAAVLKPGRNGAVAAELLAAMLTEVGLPPALVSVTEENADAASAAIAAGVDKVVLTGSARTGRAVLHQLAETLTPATMELSGSDALFVLPTADLDMVADAALMGQRLNGGATCIAPRRIIAHRDVAVELERRLRIAFASSPPVPVDPIAADIAEHLISEAKRRGAALVAGQRTAPERMRPALLLGVSPSMRLLREDVFAPVVSMMTVDSIDEAVAANATCPYALGASVFGEERAALALAGRIDAGAITINDLIVPTADPRLPFGGRRQSGFGVTRGGDGLLDMTTIKVVAVRGGKFRPHYEPLQPGDAELAASYLRLAHGRGVVRRAASLRTLVHRLLQKGSRGKGERGHA